MAVGESEDTFIVSSLSRPRASEYALHQNDFRFQEGNHTKTVAVHPRDPLCVIYGRLIGSHPRLIQVGAGELAAVNQETGAVVQVSLGDCWGNRIKVVRLAALEEERRRGSACADRSTPSQSIGVHPRSKAIFLCSKTKEDGEVALRMDIYNNVGRMKRDCCRNHTTCTTRKEEGSLDPTDIFASENAVEHFRANFDASTGSLRVEMTEIAVGASGSKRSFRAERKLGEGAILSAPIRVERVHRKNSVGSSGDFWILQCSQNLSLLLGRGLGGAELSVEHFSGRSCGFVSREDEGQPGVSFSVVNGRTFGLYERAAASEACSLIASHKLAESAEPSRLVSCRLAPSSSAGNSLIDYTWISDHGVFSGRADDPSGQVQIKAAWRLNAAHERILDATGVAAAVSVGLSGARVSASLALLTQRRLLFLSEDLCAARQIVLSENHGQVASLHWLESSKTLVCLGQARAMQVGEWDGYASMRSILSLDQTQSPSDHSEGSGFGGVGTSASGKSVLYFDRPLPGLQGGKVLACALPPPLGEDLGQQQKESVVIREIIEDLQPKVTKAESKIGFSIGGLNLQCHVDSPPSDQEKHLSLLMTNPSLVDLRYDEDPIQRVSTTDKDVIRIVLNLVAAGGSKETLRALFTDEKRRGSNGSEVGDETGAILQLNPYLMEMIQERSAPSSKMATASANGSADAAAENLTQSPAPSLLDSDAGHLTPGAPSSAGKGGAHAAQGLPSPDMPVVVSEPGNIDGNVSSGFGGGKWSDSDDSDEDSSSIFGSFSATSNARKKIMINIKPLAQGSATSSTSGGGGAGDLKSAIANLTLGSPPMVDLRTPPQEKKPASGAPELESSEDNPLPLAPPALSPPPPPALAQAAPSGAAFDSSDSSSDDEGRQLQEKVSDSDQTGVRGRSHRPLQRHGHFKNAQQSAHFHRGPPPSDRAETGRASQPRPRRPPPAAGGAEGGWGAEAAGQRHPISGGHEDGSRQAVEGGDRAL